VAAGLGLTALAGVLWLGAALADDPTAKPAPVDGPSRVQLAIDAGKHIRIEGPRGIIHVWVPPSYHADTGATVIYLHGYYDDADSAWTGHQLPQQFAMAALNAVFIVPEAPSGSRQPVNYPDLGELLRIVEDRTGITRGQALTAVVGHSGAFRTIHEWLNEPLVDELVLIDSMYADVELIETWWRESPRHRVVTVGEDTILWTEELARNVPETLILDRFPPTYDTWPAEAKTARLVYIRAQYMHMPLVMEGIVLPSLLRLLPVELLGDEPWQEPLGSLPMLPDAAVDDAGRD
jgi:hypothetical protein